MTLEDHNNASVNASDPEGAQAIQEILSAAGINGRRLRYLLSMLIERPMSFDTLVRESAVEHRTMSGVNYLCRSASIIFAGFSFPFFHSFVVVGDSFHLLI